MTLERHKSKLIPDVDFGGDGRLFVTDNDGTFPMRGAKKGKERVPTPDYEDVKSYRSYDPKRNKRVSGRFKQKEPSRFAKEVNDAAGTWGSGNASLQRKLRRLKGDDDQPPGWEYDIDHPARRFGRGDMGTWSSAGKHNRRKRQQNRLSKGEYPRLEYPGSLSRAKGTKPLDLESIKAYKERMKDRKNSMLEIYNKTNGGKMPLITEVPIKVNYYLLQDAIVCPICVYDISPEFHPTLGLSPTILNYVITSLFFTLLSSPPPPPPL